MEERGGRADGVEYLAGEDVPEGGEGVVERLVVDSEVQVLYEDVAESRAADGRVPLRPHDSHRLLEQQVEVHRVERSFRYRADQQTLVTLINKYF